MQIERKYVWDFCICTYECMYITLMFSCGEIGHKLRWIVVHLCIKKSLIWPISMKKYKIKLTAGTKDWFYTPVYYVSTSSCFPR